MGRPRSKRAKGRRSWNSGHVLQLQTGWDFFGDAWGDVLQYRQPDDPRRAEWPSDDTLADMQLAWEALRDGRLANPGGHPMESQECFGYRVFELGESPQEAMKNRRAYQS